MTCRRSIRAAMLSHCVCWSSATLRSRPGPPSVRMGKLSFACRLLRPNKISAVWTMVFPEVAGGMVAVPTGATAARLMRGVSRAEQADQANRSERFRSDLK